MVNPATGGWAAGGRKVAVIDDDASDNRYYEAIDLDGSLQRPIAAELVQQQLGLRWLCGSWRYSQGRSGIAFSDAATADAFPYSGMFRW